MAPIPPWPQEFLTRLIADTRAALAFDERAVRAYVAATLPARHRGIMSAEERALVALEQRWDELAPALDAALGDVELEYEHYPERAASARSELDVLGTDAWIARAVRAQLSFDIGWDALGDRGELTEY